MNEAFQTEEKIIDGVRVKIDYFYDDTYRGKPWAEYDGNVNIYEFVNDQPYWANTKKRPSEVILKTNGDRLWAYDMREALEKARREAWGCSDSEGLTKKQIALRAVQENVEFWSEWLNDEWYYVGVVCTALDDDDDEIDSESCWGFESRNDYHETASQEIAQNLADRVNREAMERKYWAQRDIMTGSNVGAYYL